MQLIRVELRRNMLIQVNILSCLLLCGQLVGQEVDPTLDPTSASELVISLVPTGDRINLTLNAMLDAVKELNNDAITTELVTSSEPASLIIRGLTEEEKQALMSAEQKLQPSPALGALSISGLTPLSGVQVAAVDLAGTVTCVTSNSSCCRRSLPTTAPLQTHLDLLDSHTEDRLFSSPLACADKMHVFLLSTGIQANHPAFANVTVIVEPDCPTGAGWVTGADLSGRGTGTAGMIVTPYGVTPNVILHSVKMTQAGSLNSGTLQQWTCAINLVRSWFTADASRKAIVLATSIDNTTPTSTAPLIQSLLNSFGNRMLFVCRPQVLFPPASVSGTLAVDWAQLSGTTIFYTNTNGVTTDVAVEFGDVVSPTLNSAVISTTNWFTQAAGVAVGVLSQYWLEHPTLTGNALRDLIQNNAISDIHNVADFTRSPATAINKVMKYACTTGCPVCLNGGFPVNRRCICPQGTTGGECGEFVCEADCRFGHPTKCNFYVQCPGGKPIVLRCPTTNDVQLYFDVVSRSCKLPCDAHVRPGCSISR